MIISTAKTVPGAQLVSCIIFPSWTLTLSTGAQQRSRKLTKLSGDQSFCCFSISQAHSKAPEIFCRCSAKCTCLSLELLSVSRQATKLNLEDNICKACIARLPLTAAPPLPPSLRQQLLQVGWLTSQGFNFRPCWKPQPPSLVYQPRFS